MITLNGKNASRGPNHWYRDETSRAFLERRDKTQNLYRLKIINKYTSFRAIIYAHKQLFRVTSPFTVHPDT